MDKNIHSIIEIFSLSQVEAEVFEYLLEYGNIRTAELRKVLHLERTPLYRAVNTLENRGLIKISGSARLQTINLVSLKNISQLLSQKKKEISAAEKSLSKIMVDMKDLRDNRFIHNNIQLFSGSDAYLHSMQSILKGGGKLLRDITPDSQTLYTMAGSQAKYDSIVKTIKAERIKRNIYIQILFDNQAKNIDSHSLNSQKDLKESRRFDGNLHLNCYLNTCGSKSLFYTQDKTGSWGIVIDDSFITNLLNSLFDVLWSQSKSL